MGILKKIMLVASSPFAATIPLAVWAISLGRQIANPFLHDESAGFVAQYLDTRRGLLEHVFDPHRNDWGTYQARELSYLFDYLDVQALRFFSTMGWITFVSIVHFVILGISGWLLFRFFSRRLQLAVPTSSLLVALFLSAPCVFLSGNLFRTAKILVVLFFVLAVEQLFSLIQKSGSFAQGRKELVWSGVGLGFFSTLLTLTDRQGFALAILLFAVAVVQILGLRRFTSGFLLSVSMTMLSVILGIVYNYWIGPAIIQNISGYAVSFEYQRVDWSNLISSVQPFIDGWSVMIDTFRFLFGGVPASIATLGLGMGSIWFILAQEQRWKNSLLIIGLALGLVGLASIMIVRHPPLAAGMMRSGYYWIPATMVCVLGAGFFLRAFNARSKQKFVGVVLVVLWLVLASNVAGLPRHMGIVSRGMYQNYLLSLSYLAKECVEMRDDTLLNVKPLNYIIPRYQGYCRTMRASFDRGVSPHPREGGIMP